MAAWNGTDDQPLGAGGELVAVEPLYPKLEENDRVRCQMLIGEIAAGDEGTVIARWDKKVIAVRWDFDKRIRRVHRKRVEKI